MDRRQWQWVGVIASILALLVVGIVELPIASRAAEPRDDEQTIVDELKLESDPTILERRIWLDNEWNNFNDGSNNLEDTLAGLWAWPVSANQDWAVRLRLPLDFHWAGDSPGDSDEAGLGDIKLATGTAVRFAESVRGGVGVEMRFPTATNNRLGDNAWTPQLFGAFAWDISKTVTFSPSVEYNRSIAEEDGATPKHFLEAFFPLTFVLPHHWAVAAQYEAKVDFEQNDTWTNSAKLILSKRFEGPFGLTLAFKKPFDNTNKDFQVNAIFTYFFAAKKPATSPAK